MYIDQDNIFYTDKNVPLVSASKQDWFETLSLVLL